MAENGSSQKYDLEDRTFLFAQNVRSFVRLIPQNAIVIDDLKQLLRASGSVGANYIEANESLGDKDFIMRIKICRKEAKESRYWLRLLIDIIEEGLRDRRNELEQEAFELMNIFGAIVRNRK